MKTYRKLTIFLSDETISELEKFVSFENNKNLLWKQEREKYSQVSDLIRGIIIDYLEQLKSQDTFAGLDDLGKPYRLRNNFKEITMSKNLSQQQIAEKTNIEPSNISLIFRNKNQPSLDYFLRIWIALGCPPISDCLYREIAEK